ncbi:hypothetical protein [Corynebacterium sp. A21]|uniref:hypothetical protein n=1 Tax=Corynebacterium sp. A21 TaxID=3457318 RepID=UPI003FD4B5ED
MVLLAAGSEIEDVASRTGYQSTSAFGAAFRRVTGNPWASSDRRVGNRVALSADGVLHSPREPACAAAHRIQLRGLCAGLFDGRTQVRRQVLGCAQLRTPSSAHR